MQASSLNEIIERLSGMPPDAVEALRAKARESKASMPWVPNPGSQTRAFLSEADELFYAGEPGGGKSHLLCGLALTRHRRSLILRRVNKDTTTKLIPAMADIVSHRNGLNGQLGTWQISEDRFVAFSGCEQESDKQRFKGDPHDLKGFDELPDFLESQYRFIIAWNRSAISGQRCRVVATGNPPTTPEGQWVTKYWGAWLDPTHPKFPTPEGVLRWYTSIDGRDVEMDGPGPHLVNGEMLLARSRTFIRSLLADNLELDTPEYRATLAALPADLRPALKDGDFGAGIQDHERQTIPTAWITAAMDRWRPDGHSNKPMTAIGCDVAQGGPDKTTLAPRHGDWYAQIVAKAGKDTPDGNAVLAEIIIVRRNGAVVIVDCGGGYGGDTMGRLADNAIACHGFVGSAGSSAKPKFAKDGGPKIGFKNKRAEATWRFREALDPDQDGGSTMALPPDAELKSDLASFRYSINNGLIQIEDKAEIKKRIGRSPDKGDAVIIAYSEGEAAIYREATRSRARPVVSHGYSSLKRRR